SAGTGTISVNGAVTGAGTTTLNASTLNVTSSPAGDVGSSSNNVQTNAANISSNSNFNVYLADSAAAVALAASSAASGKAFQLTDSSGTVNVNGAITGAGTTTLNASTLNVTSSPAGDVGSSSNNVQTNAATVSSNSTFNVYLNDSAAA